MAVHVRYKSLYISQPSSAKQQRELLKLPVNRELKKREKKKSSFRFVSIIFVLLVSPYAR